jgi:hypothetical protein
VSASAFDWGGYVDNTTGIALPSAVGNTVDLVQSTSLALWAQAQLGNWDFSSQGSYTYTPTVPLLFEIDELTFSTSVIAGQEWVSTVDFTAGRTGFADRSGAFLSATLDGLMLQLSGARSSLRASAATNALAYRPTNPIVISNLDASPIANQDAIFAPPRLLVGLDFRALEVLAGQHLNLGVLVQEDLRPDADLTDPFTDTKQLTGGGRLDTQYVSIGLSGSLAPGLFQRVYYTLNTGRTLSFVEDAESPTGSWYEYQMVLGHLAGLEMTYFLPEVLNSRIRAFGQFSSGDPDAEDYIEGNTAGMSTSFIPLAAPVISNTFSLKPGNSAHLGVSYSARSLALINADVLQTEFKAVMYLRTSGSGAVSESSVNPDSDGVYVGSDLNLVLTYQPLSDVRIVLANGVFLPNADVMNAGSKNVQYQGTLQAVIRF